MNRHGYQMLFVIVVATVWTSNAAQLSDESVPKVQPSQQSAPASDEKEPIQILFTYGSEKESWVAKMTERFHVSNPTIANGRPIKVDHRPMGSAEVIRTVLQKKIAADIVSPASTVFIRIANGLMPDDEPIIGPTKSLVRSPVVIAMWKTMADALRAKKGEIGWAEILDLVGSEQGWESVGLPAGRFKFGHTHPEMSNSGIQSLIAIAYAGCGKTEGLTVEDVNSPELASFVKTIEGGVVHFGESTGFFAKKMFKYGPRNLSAVVMYENMVMESYDPKLKLEDKLVAIYPKEGTFWTDHPIGIINRPWVDKERREACEIYIKFLLQRPQQEEAMKLGFRPGDESIPLSEHFSTSRGIDPEQPKKLLEVPSLSVTRAILDLWRKQKRLANVVLTIDTSGSMLQDRKLEKAKQAAAKIVDVLGDDDEMSILTFDSKLKWVAEGTKIKGNREQLVAKIKGLQAIGKTALYDAVVESEKYFNRSKLKGAIQAVIVLSDGEDTASNASPDQMFRQLAPQPDKLPTLVFTVAYGSEADQGLLRRIADATQADSWVGTTSNISEVLKKAGAFFSSRSPEGF